MIATLSFIIKDNKVLLGHKKRGLGKGKLLGFGGKLEKGETPEQAAVRELFEECSIVVSKTDLKSRGILLFSFHNKRIEDMRVHVFLCEIWKGNPVESDDMCPEWFDLDNLPYEKMWDDNRYWLPHLISGKSVEAKFVLDDNDIVVEKKVSILDMEE